MNSSFPKSESTTSLLKSSTRGGTHLRERPAESRKSQPPPPPPQLQPQHHRRPAGLRSSTGSRAEEDESTWSPECDTSARRPLCHPSLSVSQDTHDNATNRDKCKHAPRYQVPDSPDAASIGARERCRPSKPPHRHHYHRRKHTHREDRPPAAGAAGAAEPELPRRGHSRAVPCRGASLSDRNEDRDPLCKPRANFKGSSLANSSSSQVTSSPPPPTSCPLVPLLSRSSRRSRRSSVASSTSELNLRAVLNSLFGQVSLGVSRI